MFPDINLAILIYEIFRSTGPSHIAIYSTSQRNDAHPNSTRELKQPKFYEIS
jgi:hypothetical protein